MADWEPVSYKDGFTYRWDLGDLIYALKNLDSETPMRATISHPHSFRGDYYDLAFEIKDQPSTAGEWLIIATSAKDKTFEGWKGGHFPMDVASWVHIVNSEGDFLSETMGSVLFRGLVN
jgi:hypothetical protein